MKISQLLAKDQCAHLSEALKENFGDAFLIQNNSIYAKIRKLTLKSGFQFSFEKNNDYDILPLTQLEALFAASKIPYLCNRRVLSELEKQYPNKIYWDDIMDGFKKNHLFHESCHVVARRILQIHKQKFENLVEFRVLKMLLEESFSNTCELLAVIDVGDSAHRIFFEWNSYICMFDDRTNLKKFHDEGLGSLLFNFMLFSYLHANFLCDGINERAFHQVLQMIPGAQDIDPRQKKFLRSFSKIAFQLNPRFREVTTGLHLKLQGVNTPLRQALDFDFMKIIENNLGFQASISDFVQSLY